MLAFFQIQPHVDLNSMRQDQRLVDLTARLLVDVEHTLAVTDAGVYVVTADEETLIPKPA